MGLRPSNPARRGDRRLTVLNYAERFLLLQALIIRRVPTNSRIPSLILMEALQADHKLVKEKAPHLYFNDHLKNISQEVAICVETNLIEDGQVPAVRSRRFARQAPKSKTYRRTRLGDQFLNSLEPRLEEALDEMPMSNVAVLDFLSLL